MVFIFTGRIYNITHYLDYHPGGIEELMRGAGKDGTNLFDEVRFSYCMGGHSQVLNTFNRPRFWYIYLLLLQSNVQVNLEVVDKPTSIVSVYRGYTA